MFTFPCYSLEWLKRGLWETVIDVRLFRTDWVAMTYYRTDSVLQRTSNARAQWNDMVIINGILENALKPNSVKWQLR